MGRIPAMLLALALALGACEEQGVCGGGCANSLDIALHQAQWPDGEYVLEVRYAAHRRDYVHVCTFTLPGGDDAACDDERPEGHRTELSIGATIGVHLPDGPDRVAVELVDPTGHARTAELEPSYEEHEFCGQTCRNGSMTTTLD